MPCELCAGPPLTLVLGGALGIADAPALRAAALEAVACSDDDVHVDLGGCERLDTAATQVLLALRAALAARGHALFVQAAPAPVVAAWEVSGFDGNLEERSAP